MHGSQGRPIQYHPAHIIAILATPCSRFWFLSWNGFCAKHKTPSLRGQRATALVLWRKESGAHLSNMPVTLAVQYNEDEENEDLIVITLPGHPKEVEFE